MRLLATNLHKTITYVRKRKVLIFNQKCHELKDSVSENPSNLVKFCFERSQIFIFCIKECLSEYQKLFLILSKCVSSFWMEFSFLNDALSNFLKIEEN